MVMFICMIVKGKSLNVYFLKIPVCVCVCVCVCVYTLSTFMFVGFLFY